MAWVQNTRDVTFILNKLEETLDNIWIDCQVLRELGIDEVDVLACDIEVKMKDYKRYTRQYKEVIDRTQETNEKLKTQNIILRSELKELRKQVQERLDTMDSLIELVNENAKAVAFSKYTKDKDIDKTGKNCPRYRKDINDEQLVKDYRSGKILKELAKDYNMTIPGIRNRLIELGVYKQVYNKK